MNRENQVDILSGKKLVVERGSVDIEQTIAGLATVSGINLPRNKHELRVFKSYLSEVSYLRPLTIYVGSCPDYSHTDGLYDHRFLGSDIPLLTQDHLKAGIPFLRMLDANNIPYVYKLMIADVEAIDETFCKKFTGGSEEEFLRRCEESEVKSRMLMNRLKSEQGIKGEVSSTSFFETFTRERFMEYQGKYAQLLLERYESDSGTRSRINGDTVARMAMYKRMYDGVTDGMSLEQKQAFYVARTIRTMAQYLTLGRLISEKDGLPLVINHPTRNLGVYNDRNKFLLPEDGNKLHSTIPIFEMTTKVY